jgi:N-acetylglucosaminyldiphosphoundecaprenol N-acetyl-beta-D-mannosaminyltransferase
MDQVLGVVDETITARGRLLVGVVNAAKLVNMSRDPALREAVLSADMILADGMSVVWASRLLGSRLPERVAGIDLMERMLERGRAQGYRVYCLGATEEVLTEVVERIGRDYPGVNVVGQHHGYFGEDQEPTVAEAIRAARPDILFVAMSSPKKEVFLARWRERIEVPVCHGVGGAFDVLAGKVKRAPGLWQRVGLEWFYRVVQEPHRMWRRYLVTNTMFCCMLAGEMVGRFRPRRA